MTPTAPRRAARPLGATEVAMYALKTPKKPGPPLPTAVDQAAAEPPAHKQLAALPFEQQAHALAPPGQPVAANRPDQAHIEVALARDPALLTRALEQLGRDPEAAAALADRMKGHEDVQRFIVGRFPPAAEAPTAQTPAPYVTASGFSGLTVNAQNATGQPSMSAAMMSQMGQTTGVKQPQNAVEVKVETDALEKAIAAFGDLAKFVAWVAVKVVEVLGQAARALVTALPIGWLVTAVAQTLLGTKAGLLLLPLLLL